LHSFNSTLFRHYANVFFVILERKTKGSNTPISSPLSSPQKANKRIKSKLNNVDILIQEAVNQTERGKVIIMDVAKDLPENLSNWDSFVCAYYSQIGTVIKFVKIDDSRWSILKETERETWTVGKWSKVQ
jgi:hypothetical protein